MAWERRRNGRTYYYHWQRVGLRAVKQYVGSGEKGRRAAEADQAGREAYIQEALQRAENRRPVDKLAAHFNQFDRMLEQLVVCQLVSAGWRQHHRQWMAPKR
jgi:hypothetical protein